MHETALLVYLMSIRPEVDTAVPENSNACHLKTSGRLWE